MIYKFVKHSIPPITELKNTPVYQLYDKLINNKEKPTRQDKDTLFHYLHASHSKSIKRGGWAFDFSDILKEYWVQFYGDSIFVYYACDKTSIRTNPYMTGITKIVEATKCRQN